MAGESAAPETKASGCRPGAPEHFLSRIPVCVTVEEGRAFLTGSEHWPLAPAPSALLIHGLGGIGDVFQVQGTAVM